MIACVEKLEIETSELLSCSTDILKINNSYKNKIKFASNFSQGLTLIGFFVFLLISNNYLFSSLFYSNQNVITLIGFGVVLLNYYLKEIFVEELSKKERKNEIYRGKMEKVLNDLSFCEQESTELSLDQKNTTLANESIEI